MIRASVSCPLLMSIALALTAAGCRGREKAVSVLIAQGLTLPFTEIVSEFEASNPGTRVKVLYASSGTLARQIEAGMPADVYCSASTRYMDEMVAEGLVSADSVMILGGNSIVLIRSTRFSRPVNGAEGLVRHDVQRIAIGNPGHVPAGRYAMQALEKLELAGKLEAKFVLCENVRQALAFVSRGEVDAGFVFKSDALSDPEGVSVEWEVPGHLHDPVLFTMAVLEGSADPASARLFASFVSGPAGRSILDRHGFALPKEGK